MNTRWQHTGKLLDSYRIKLYFTPKHETVNSGLIAFISGGILLQVISETLASHKKELKNDAIM